MAHTNSNPGVLYQTPHCGADTQSQVNFEVDIPYKLRLVFFKLENSIQIMRLECHKEPYNTALWTHKRGM